MTRKQMDHGSPADICQPIATYVVTRRGLKLAPGSTPTDAWNNLSDVGRRLSLPHKADEPISNYAQRLRAALDRLHPHECIDGAAVFMLRLIVNLYCPASANKSKRYVP